MEVRQIRSQILSNLREIEFQVVGCQLGMRGVGGASDSGATQVRAIHNGSRARVRLGGRVRMRIQSPDGRRCRKSHLTSQWFLHGADTSSF